jgi:carbamoyltransferase
MDGVGEWATASDGFGKGNEITLLKELHFPDSLGLLYSAFTYFTGFKVNSGEYKLMGLAPYGVPRYKDLILSEIVDLKEDGSIRLDLSYFDFLGGLRMTNKRFARLFDGPRRTPETEITQREMDIAASIQAVTEEIVLRMVNHVHKETNQKYLCLAGGVALNCVANGRILREGPFEDIWIQPAAGDAGGAIGAALSVWHRYLGNKRPDPKGFDGQQGSYLGPSFSNESVKKFLESKSYPYHELNKNERPGAIAKQIAEGKIVGYMAGRMEFGPRALGARSILGDPRRQDTQTVMNLKIKYRESFRPFAPSVIEEKTSEYFDTDRPSPYMLLTADVQKERRFSQSFTKDMSMLDRLKVKRINVRGEPIICSLEDAYRCFMRTEMDVLVMEDYMLFKEEQPTWEESEYWRDDLQLD